MAGWSTVLRWVLFILEQFFLHCFVIVRKIASRTLEISRDERRDDSSGTPASSTREISIANLSRREIIQQIIIRFDATIDFCKTAVPYTLRDYDERPLRSGRHDFPYGTYKKKTWKTQENIIVIVARGSGTIRAISARNNGGMLMSREYHHENTSSWTWKIYCKESSYVASMWNDGNGYPVPIHC